MQLSFKQKAAYGLGAVGKDMVYALSASYVMFYYQDTLGLSASFVGLILMIARIFDALNDPFMGVLVARTRSRWGRFRPWLFTGTVLNAAVTYALFAAPVRTGANLMVYFSAVVYTEYRYILGTRGRDPLICIGINPSTARPDRLDPTLQSVERIALHNGFDSFLMLNLCAQRATDPDDMTRSYPDALRQGNIDAFLYALGRSERPTVWCAWGTLIEKRPFIADLLRDLVRAAGDRQPAWVSAGPKSKKGHPHHPLYLRSDAVTEPFDMDAYLASLK